MMENKETTKVEEQDKIQEELNQLQQTIDTLQEEIKILEEKSSKTNKKVRELENELHSTNTKNNQLDDKNKLIEKESESLKIKVSQTTNKNKKIKSNIKKAIISTGLIISLSALALFYKKQKEESIPYSITEEKVTLSYNNFRKEWNKQVRQISPQKKFLLSSNDNQELLNNLNQLLKNFYIAEISHNQQYNLFLENNKIEKPVVFSTHTTENELRYILKDITKEKSISAIVKKILIMNDKNIWLKMGQE